GTYTNISGAYGKGTALGAVAAGEGATGVLAVIMLALTLLGQSSPAVVRLGLWATPVAASVMAAMAADDPATTVIYAVTPLGMCVAAEGMAFVARRIVVFQTGRDAEAEASAAALMRSLAYHRARAANHPDEKIRARSDKTSWRLARKAGAGDTTLNAELLGVQRQRVTAGADTALGEMFTLPGTDRPELPAAGGEETSVPAPVPVRSLPDVLEEIGWCTPDTFGATSNPHYEVTTERLDQPRGELVTATTAEV
ncbi:conjugal transfer protein, partial [Streptomyces sp. DSM 42041]